jgi:hypothetical protein
LRAARRDAASRLSGRDTLCENALTQANERTIAGLILAFAALVAAYWYGSPYLAIHQIQRAVQQHDVDAFNEHVDYPALRESLKGQTAALMGIDLGKPDKNPLASLGTMLAMALSDRMVDALVRPELVMQAMKTGRLKDSGTTPGSAATPGASTPGSSSPAPSAAPERKPRWRVQRQSLDVIVADPSGTQESGGIQFVFRRHGFADWKLAEIRLPARASH